MTMDVTRIAVPFRMQPGLRRPAPGSTALTPSAPNGRHFREKVAVLAAFADQALLAVPAFDAAPALAAIAAEAALAPNAAFVLNRATGDCAAPLIGIVFIDGRVEGSADAAVIDMLNALPPSRRVAALLSLAFEEDFAVIDADAHIPWLAVCLPSRWAPEQKIGKHLAEVHASVADNAMLVAASGQLARLVTGVDRWERDVWTISADPRLHQHPSRSAASWPTLGDAEGLVAQDSFRHEHQSFLPVPGAAQAVFTIHIGSEPLDLAMAVPETARRVHDSLASMSPAVLAYRGLTPARDRLLAWLATRAGATSMAPNAPPT